MATLGIIIKDQRVSKHMKLKDLSDKTGISITSLSKYEHSLVVPTVQNLYRIAEVLGLDYDELYPVFVKEKELNGKTR